MSRGIRPGMRNSLQTRTRTMPSTTEPHPAPPAGALRQMLAGLALLCFRRPYAVLAVCGTLLAMSLGVTWNGLRLQMDWTYLFDPADPVVARVNQHRQEFPYPGDMVVLVDGGQARWREKYLDELAARLAAEPQHFQHVYHRLDLKTLRTRALYYLEPKQLRAMSAQLQLLEPLLGRSHPASGTADLLGRLRAEMSNPESALWREDSLQRINRLLFQLERSLDSRGREAPPPLWSVLLSPEELKSLPVDPEELLAGQGYLYSTMDQGRIHYLVLKSVPGEPGTPIRGDAVTRLRQILKELQPTAYGLRIRLTGLPVLLSDERQTCQADSTRSTLISLAAVTLIFLLGFGGVRRPLLAVSALVVGLGWTMGFTTLAVGHLNFITVTYLTILLGMGVDFGIHLTFRYSEERQAGAQPEEALRTTMTGTGADLLVGAVATAVGFLVLIPVGFRGVAELGLIGGAGVLLCYVSTITVLPAGLGLDERRGRKEARRPQSSGALRLERKLLERASGVVLAALLISALAAYYAGKVGFDHNLLHMQASNLESIQTEEEMIRQLHRTVLSATVLTDDIEQARRLDRIFRDLPVVASVSSAVSLLPPGSEARTPLVRELVTTARRLSTPMPQRVDSAEGLVVLAGLFEEVRAQVASAHRRAARAGAPEQRELAALKAHLDGLEKRLSAMGPGPIERGLSSFQRELLGDVEQTLSFLQSQEPVPPSAADLPEALRIRWVGETGKFQLSVLPRENIWERDSLERFLSALNRVNPEMVGHPVVMDYITTVISRTHSRAAVWTFLAVALVMILYLRSPSATVLALLPTSLGVLWMLGAMGWCDVAFNAANFVALPMVVGIGAVYGVHVLHRIQEEQTEEILTSSTGPAQLLSGLTTIAGFASLMVAHHRGISSLGFVVAVGVAANLAISLLLTPALCRLLRGWRDSGRRMARRPRRCEASFAGRPKAELKSAGSA
ncbi:MAG: MMPL family transporter [Armatimonadetes bacterium]|nr:MMPL family transporter [Armatimonadota bacterium]